MMHKLAYRTRMSNEQSSVWTAVSLAGQLITCYSLSEFSRVKSPTLPRLQIHNGLVGKSKSAVWTPSSYTDGHTVQCRDRGLHVLQLSSQSRSTRTLGCCSRGGESRSQCPAMRLSFPVHFTSACPLFTHPTRPPLSEQIRSVQAEQTEAMQQCVCLSPSASLQLALSSSTPPALLWASKSDQYRRNKPKPCNNASVFPRPLHFSLHSLHPPHPPSFERANPISTGGTNWSHRLRCVQSIREDTPVKNRLS